MLSTLPRPHAHRKKRKEKKKKKAEQHALFSTIGHQQKRIIQKNTVALLSELKGINLNDGQCGSIEHYVILKAVNWRAIHFSA